MADTLSRSGHRRIAYISSAYHLDWVQNRYAGICRFFKQYAGPKAGVELFALDEISNLTDLILEVLDLDRSQISALFKAPYPNQNLDDLARAFDKMKTRRLLKIDANNPKVETLRAEARHLCRLAKESHDPEIFGRFFDALHDRASSYAVGLYLQPLFEKALKTSSATAWVCSDDKSALAAMSFLASEGVGVPDDISVVGFDNWAGNFYCGLSSYDFNMNGMILQALGMIADPKSLNRIPPVMEFDGYLVERKSIKKVQ